LALHIGDTFSGGLLLHQEEACLHLDSGVQIPLVVCWSHSLKVPLLPVLHLFPTTNNMLHKELQQNLKLPFCIFPINIKYTKTNGTGTTHTSLKCLGSKKHDYHSQQILNEENDFSRSSLPEPDQFVSGNTVQILHPNKLQRKPRSMIYLWM
jgi:hypothetical protein